MINTIINFLKSIFIKDKEGPTMEALHNISIPMDTEYSETDAADYYTGPEPDGTQKEKQEMSKFDEIIEVVLEHEGGYVNDPKDPGGETNFGIAKRSHPDVDIKNLTKEGAKEIYKEVYWDKNKVESLPEYLWHIYFDMCVNQGKSRAVRIIQRAVNGKGGSLDVDGGLGPMTIAAIDKSKVELGRVRAYRVKYYADLVTKKPDLERFYFGWFKRALEV
jgi:lysozyme family protein